MLCVPGIHTFLETFNLLKGFNTELQNVLSGMQSKSYADCLKLLGIESLQTRHCFFDLTEVYKNFE